MLLRNMRHGTRFVFCTLSNLMKSPSSVRMAVAAVLAAAGIPALSYATTDYFWNNAAGGTWSTDGNWNISSYPGSSSSDTATISLAGAYTVSLDTNIGISGLTLSNPDLALDTGSTYALNVLGAVDFQSGTITGNGITISSGSLNLGINSGAATFTTQGTNSLTGNILGSQTVNVAGSSGFGNSVLLSSGLSNYGTLRLNSTSDGSAELAFSSGSLINDTNGLLEINSIPTYARLNADLVNNGTVSVTDSSYGYLSKNSGSYTNNGQFSTGAYSVVLVTDAATFTQAGGQLDSQGRFEVSQSTFQFNGGTITGNAPILTNSTLKLDGSSGRYR